MTAVHANVGGLMAVLFAAAGGLGGWRWWRVEPSEWFWRLLRAAQVLMVVEAALGGVLLLTGARPSDDLHYVYGLLPLAVSFVAEQLRIASAETVLAARGLDSAQDMRALDEAGQRSIVLAIVRRELGVMALAALVILGLALRAEFGPT
ncbi:MAG: hypothetical protein QOH11_2334 [Solirubrobacteraceae bacterium]|nr:hypothetical protein [Solirubrobacteraceae bacterium]